MKIRSILSIDPYSKDFANPIVTITQIPINWIRVETIKKIKKLNEKI